MYKLVAIVFLMFWASKNNLALGPALLYSCSLLWIGLMVYGLTGIMLVIVLLMTFIVNFALSLIIGVFSLLGHQRFGWDEQQNGLYFGLIGISSFLTQMFGIRFLVKKLSEVDMIKLGLVIFSASIVVMGLSPWQWLTIVVGALTPFAVSLMMINTQSLISLESKPEEQGIVLGVAQSFGSLGMVFGPLLGGAIGIYSLSLPFILSGIVTLGIFFFGQSYLKLIHLQRKAAQTGK